MADQLPDYKQHYLEAQCERKETQQRRRAAKNAYERGQLRLDIEQRRRENAEQARGKRGSGNS